jgi:hypothetical protein
MFPALACVGAAMTTRLRQESVRTLTDWLRKGDIPQHRRGVVAMLFVILAFVPVLMAVIFTALDVSIPNSEALLFIDLPAFLRLGLTCFYYRRTRTKSAAWLFAPFPIAFAQPVMLAFLWFSSAHPPK